MEEGCAEEARRLEKERELSLGFFDVMRPIEKLADLGERKHSHHEGVVPKLIVVVREVGHVLHAIKGCPGQAIHGPFRP